MTKTLLNDFREELITAQVYIERSEAMLGAITEEYFNERANDPNTVNGKEYIIAAFDENRVCAEIARDYITQTRQVVDGLAAALSDAEENNATPDKCDGCKIKERGWCSPLKKFQCDHDFDDGEFIRLLILSLNDKHREIMRLKKEENDG